ncbi:MAG TPA: aminoglycoside 3'-phosphotransferase [Acidimicrobiales bacterium]|nr:aminoglycoside 3'-phosphotransferase [Acidimicrobiales bacterium]
MLAGPPRNPVTLPASLHELVGGRAYEVVWVNQVGGLTLRVGESPASRYVKWVPAASGGDVSDELERLSWASAYTPVPRVLDSGNDAEGSWFVTEAIDAQNAVSPEWRREPRTAIAALGTGLRALHDALPREDCPFEWSAASRLAATRARADKGEFDEHEWSSEFEGMTLESAIDELGRAPSEDLVVCHGDACAPNTLIDASGHWVAHLDFDQLGVGDRWADLAVASWSTVWNYGPGWEDTVYEAYGVAPDHEKIRYYRLLWEF